MSVPGRSYDAIIIGAGLSGLMAALSLARAGLKTAVFAKGGGYLHFTSGCIDLLARQQDGAPVSSPLANISALAGDHPYSLAGQDSLRKGLELFREVTTAAGLVYAGDPAENITLPTAIGSIRRTCLAPTGMTVGTMSDRSPILIAGFRNFRDFYPPYLAANLANRSARSIHSLYVDLPEFRTKRHLIPIDVARALDDPAMRRSVARQVRASLGSAERVGFPAVLGLDRHPEALRHLTEQIGSPVFEIPTLPPSVPGIRLYNVLRRALMREGVRIEIGFWVKGTIEGGRVLEITLNSAGHRIRHQAEAYVLATGGTGSGGIAARPDGSLRETVFDLPVQSIGARSGWYRERFLGPEPQPIALAGVRVDVRLRPFGPTGATVDNLFVTASNLRGWDPVREGSGEGVAIATGQKAAQEVLAAGGVRQTMYTHP